MRKISTTDYKATIPALNIVTLKTTSPECHTVTHNATVLRTHVIWL